MVTFQISNRTRYQVVTECVTIDSSHSTSQLNGGGFEWNLAHPYNGGLPESKAAWWGGKWAGLRIKLIQPPNVQEGNQTVPTDTHQGTITEDSIVSGLQRLAVLIEKENEVTKEFQDLIQSIPQYEVRLTTEGCHERKYEQSGVPSIYDSFDVIRKSNDFPDIDKDSHRHILFASVCN